MRNHNFIDLLHASIQSSIQDQDIQQALQTIQTFKAADIADLLTQLPIESSQILLVNLPARAYVFSYLKPDQQIKLAKVIPWATLAQIIGEMPSDKRVDIFKQLNSEQQNILLPALAQAKREDIRQLASYVEGTAGAIMSSEYATLKPNMTVLEAIKMLRLEAPDTETIYLAYVLDAARKLLGVISLKELILAQEQDCIQDLMTTDLIFSTVDTHQDEVVKKIARYDLLALPIVDEQGFMVGIVTHDDAMDVANDEATEDFLKASAVETSRKLSLKTAPIILLYQKRVFWLVILVFGSLLSGIGISHFEDIIAANIVLVFFFHYWLAVEGMQVHNRRP